MVIFNTIVLLILDFYIYKALRATSIRWASAPSFPKLWWGYSVLLTAGVVVSIYASIPLILRSIILVAFFITFSSKFIFMLILLVDDIRRGGVWIKRLLLPKKETVEPVEETQLSTAELDAPLPERPVKGIKRSEFLTRAGILVASVPM